MMSIKAYAKTQGIAVTSVNGLVAGHGSVQETWLAMQSAAALSGTPRLVGFSCIDTFPEVLWLAQRARQAWDGVRIVIGNAMATLNYERILRQHDCFDYVVVGDGEVAFTKLALALANDAAVDDVPGLARRSEQGQILRTPSSLVDLDELPRPARDELPTVLADGFAASVFSTRGCPYRCTFCGTGAMSAMLGKDSYRAKSVDAVVDEIDYLVSDYDVNFLSITDDLFISKHPGSQQRAADFANAVLRRGISVNFMVDIRLDSVVDLDLFKHLHRRACVGYSSAWRLGPTSNCAPTASRSSLVDKMPPTRSTPCNSSALTLSRAPLCFTPPCSPTSYAKQSACCGQQSIRSASSS